jgi:predicted glycoside hydrolase/deacetylase ChbG (UPF0249 family)
MLMSAIRDLLLSDTGFEGTAPAAFRQYISTFIILPTFTFPVPYDIFGRWSTDIGESTTNWEESMKIIHAQRVVFFVTIILSVSLLLGCSTTSQPLPKRENDYRSILITADDFSASREIDQGIYAALSVGVPMSVSAMVSYDRSGTAIDELARDYPHVPIGLHLSVTAGKPLSPAWASSPYVDEQGYFLSISQLIPYIDEISPSLWYEEISAQVEFLAARVSQIDHLSSQDNLIQMYTPAVQVLSQIASEYQVPVRSALPLSQILLPDHAFPIEEVARGYIVEAAKTHPLKVASLWRYTNIASFYTNEAIFRESGVASPTYAAGGLL